MASNKAPKHDFAPAWLKIPDSENPKSTGSKQAEHGERSNRNKGRRDDHFGDRRYNSGKARSYSVDDDFYNNSPYYGYPYHPSGFNHYGNGNGHYRSPPGPYREGKFPPPGPGPCYPPGGMNGYPPAGGNGYYDSYVYGDYYQNEPPYFNHYNRPQSAAGRPRLYEKDSRKSDKENKQNGDVKKEATLEEEFPSLVSESEPVPETKGAKTLGSQGVWESGPKISIIKSPRNKSTLANKGFTSPQSNGIDNPRDSVKHTASNIYKALIPKQPSSRKIAKDPFYNSRDINSNTSPFSNSKERTRSPSTPIDLLNTRTVAHPKKLGDKKSDFLKALKDDDVQSNGQAPSKDDGNEAKACEEKEEHLVNGVSDLSVESSPQNLKILSSSIEAEQRLLKEMGWNEDDENYEITEDDMKEMQNLKKKLKEQQQRPPVKRTLPKLWSPQHHVLPSPHVQDLTVDDDDSLSTSSSDDDSDCGH